MTNRLTIPEGYPSTTSEEYTAIRRGWTKVQGRWTPPFNLTQHDIAKIIHAQQRRKVGEVPDLQAGNSRRKVETPNSTDSSHGEMARTGRSRKARDGNTRTP